MSSSGNRILKAGIDVSNASRRRQDINVTLRTKKKEEMLEKQRRCQIDTTPTPFDSQNADNQNGSCASDFTTSNLPRMIELINAPEKANQQMGLEMLRKLLSAEHNPPLDAVLATGCLPLIMQFLENSAEPQLQFEAAWILTNIASGKSVHTKQVVHHNAIPILQNLFQSPSSEVREQAVWTMGNIAGDGAECRDKCLAAGILQSLIWLLNHSESNLQTVRNIVWTISNLCRGKPFPDIEQVRYALPVVAGLLNHADEEVVDDSAWAVSYISDGSEDRIGMVIEASVVPIMIQFLTYTQSPRQTPAMRTIGNIVTGSDLQTQIVVDAGALYNFEHCLNSPKRSLRKETLWTLSNIAAGTHDQVQAVVNSGLIPQVILQLGAPEFEVRKEATWVVSNIALCGETQHSKFLLELDIIPALCEILCLHDTKATIVALETIEHFLHVGQQDVELANSMNDAAGYMDADGNPVVQAINACGGLSKIDDLQNHRSDEVYQLAARIIDEFFSFDDEDRDIAEDDDTSRNTFQF